jgi:ABC-2 type transport system ATP-binding protein
MSSDEPIVMLDRVTKRYGTFTAVEDLSLQLHKGRILGFIGPNGAGKTTTIKILVGQSRPTAGTAKIRGVDCTRDAGQIKRLVGYMPDQFGAYDNMRVREYLDFFGAAFRIPRRKRRIRLEEVMDITGTAYMRDRYVESLSHGMAQRVGIARTLIHDPDLLILDEPMNGLDPQARIEMRALLVQLTDMGKTLIVTSHILPELSRICHDVAIITQGKLRAFGHLQEILSSMNQKRIFEVLVGEGDSLEPLADCARQHLEAEAEIIPSEIEQTLRIHTTATDEAMREVLAALVAEHHPVQQVREVQLDLEATFMSITKSSSAEAKPAKPDAAVSPGVLSAKGGK